MRFLVSVRLMNGEGLPGVVGSAVGGGLLGSAVDVVDAGFGLIEAHVGVIGGREPGVGAVGEWVDGQWSTGRGRPERRTRAESCAGGAAGRSGSLHCGSHVRGHSTDLALQRDERR